MYFEIDYTAERFKVDIKLEDIGVPEDALVYISDKVFNKLTKGYEVEPVRGYPPHGDVFRVYKIPEEVKMDGRIAHVEYMILPAEVKPLKIKWDINEEHAHIVAPVKYRDSEVKYAGSEELPNDYYK